MYLPFPFSGLYYVTLGMETCEILSCRDSALYMFLLITRYLGVAQDMPSFWTKLRTMRPLPSSLVDMASLSIPILAPRPRGRLSSSTRNNNNNNHNTEIQLQQPQQHNKINDKAIDEVFGEMFAYIGLCYYRITLNLDNPEGLDELDVFLTTLLQQWRAIKHVFSQVQQLEMAAALSALTVIVQRARGNMEEALTAALVFTELAGDSLFPFVPCLQQGCWYIMRVLLETKNYFLLHNLANMLQPRNEGTYMDGILDEFKPWLEKTTE